MSAATNSINKPYVILVSLLTFVVPVLCSYAQLIINKEATVSFITIGKWFIFSAVGLRLFIAGIKQTTDPAFTAKQIFHLEGTEAYPVLRELGFANLCFGLVGILSLFFPAWRVVSAFASGLYYGIAGFQHLLKKPAGINETFALITDLIIFIFLLIYFIKMI